ncbi:MAG: permease-like cell division protein FtsX [Propionibacteriaceae bacterium]
MRHTWKETWSGLRRNASMTLAVIVTMWVSLSLFGLGLLSMQQVDVLKGRWYDKIEVTVYLCNQETKKANCDLGQNVSDAQKTAVKTALETNPDVATVTYETKQEAFKDFRETFANSPMKDILTEDQMQETFRVKMKNPEMFESIRSSVAGLRGVDNVQDLHKTLDPLFQWLNLAKWATIGASVLLLLAAALQIINTIRMAAFARRRELGIMRLVGASNFYIMLPFLLESLIAGLIGAVLAAGTMAALVYFVIIKKAQPSIQALPWIGWSHTGFAVLGVALVAIALSIIPTLFATRRYLRV